MRIPCAYANWKMNKTLPEALEFIYEFVPALFKDIDSNADGKISPEEFSAQQKQHQMGRQNYFGQNH